MEKKPAVLVLAAGSLGDSLLTLPALRALQSRAEVTLAGTSSYRALGSDLLGVQKVIPLEPLLQTLLSKGVVDPCGPSFFRVYADIYLFFKEKDQALQDLLLPLERKVHSPSKPFSEFLTEGRWAAEYWLETAVGRAVPYDSPLRHAKLEISPSIRQKGDEILGGLGLSSPLVIHPGSGSPEKNAPLSFFRNAAEKSVTESNKQVLVVWGEAKKKSIEEIRKAFQDLKGVVMLPEILELKDLIGVFSRSAAYLGNDSGVTQLASACGLRTFAVFNTTDSRIWGPQEAVILAAMRNLYK